MLCFPSLLHYSQFKVFVSGTCEAKFFFVCCSLSSLLPLCVPNPLVYPQDWVQQGSLILFLLLVGLSKSAFFPCLNVSLCLFDPVCCQLVFALPEGAFLQFVEWITKKLKLQILATSTSLPSLLQRQLTCLPNISQVS